jgi:hypothetical protein
MPWLTQPPVFYPQPLALVMGARNRAHIPRRNPDLSCNLFYASNLVSRQTEHRF